MKVRKRTLSEGWYPQNKQDVIEIFSLWEKSYKSIQQTALSCIVPHAGWYYSGKLAFAGISSLKRNFDLIVTIGGHLGEQSCVLAAFEDEFESPLGIIKNNITFLDKLKSKVHIEEDFYNDNSVEIQLPIVKYFFPSASILHLRAPLNKNSIILGECLCDLSKSMGLKIAVIGSTDLTHYGPNYSFTNYGSAKKALNWVKTVNDKSIINAMLDFDEDKILSLSLIEKAACSAGAAATACRFAKMNNVNKANLIDYYTSYDISPSESFVGYTAISYLK